MIVLIGIVKFSIFLLFTAIAVDFYRFSDQEKVKSEKRSIVETGSMTVFFLIYYGVLMSKFMVIPVSEEVKFILAVIGTGCVFFGAVLNCISRFYLSGNWSNQIKIYEGHTLVQTGMYKVVRHPLYATIMLMLLGGCVISRNALAFILTSLIFIPFMTFRARQEEAFLIKEFEAYKDYQDHVGMFFPKLIRRKNR